MGAQGEERCEKFIERFQMCEDPDNNAPSHYAVHYSSAMIVCAYLIRLEPFTQQYLQLQGGHFDHPDRLFQSIGSSWKSASEQNMADVRELIPEFFYLPEILTNHNKFNFGTNQKEEKVDDVILPKWAKGDPRLFIEKNREALESEYVNANLNDWIDLIFGYKQQGEEAVKAVNTFHYLSYEGAVDIDSIEDPIQKLATIGIINNFGQTPRQLFKKPHPKRMEIASNNTLLQQQQISQDLQLNIPQNIMNNFVSLSAQYRIHTHAKSLIQSALPIKVVPNQIISDVKLINEKVIVVGSSKTLIPPNFNKFMEIDYLDNSLRLFQTDNGKLLNVFENLMHIGHITCITFSDQDTLITGGSDAVICIWKFENSKVTNLALKSSLRGHLKKILVLAISKSYNFLVSGGEDNVAIIWDLNKKKYIKTLTGHDSPVTVLAINENTGDICTSTSTVLKIWSINGDLLFSKTVSNQISDPGRSSEVFSTVCVITGHKKGHIKLWIKMPTSSGIMSTTSQTNISTISNNKSDNALNTYMELKLVKTLEQHTNACAISYLYIPSSQRYLISGDIYGRVYSWGFPDGGNTEIHYCYGENCFSCNSKFTVLERKLNCRCCGGSK
ncbi:WD repeat and FYVE domain-containing protein 3 [Clydaea vesicula]|uniref:WD repeat and FYVE domain-containing protein 3 n=1 Tax=Clydaea vesicula TaxID=447962 RepID=A0AAD5XYT1_9FUNG|nr:WD repeat and FYVE domain-containing protein 3 [Clydaea vesicula]